MSAMWAALSNSIETITFIQTERQTQELRIHKGAKVSLHKEVTLACFHKGTPAETCLEPDFCLPIAGGAETDFACESGLRACRSAQVTVHLAGAGRGLAILRVLGYDEHMMPVNI